MLFTFEIQFDLFLQFKISDDKKFRLKLQCQQMIELSEFN